VGVKNILYEDVVACLLSVAVNLLVSPLIGIMFGFAAGFASRFTNRVTVIQPLIVFVCGYVSFCVAEMLHFSGILSYVTFNFFVSFLLGEITFPVQQFHLP